MLTYHSKSYRAIKFYLYRRNNQPEPTFALDPAKPRHYKCGARMIADVLRLRPSFNGNFTLAMTWYEKALTLGMQPAELAEIKWMLEKNGHIAQNTDDRVDLNKWSGPELDRSNLIT